MTLDEAREAVGRGVVYRPQHGRFEDGVITSVRGAWVFVRYSGDATSRATAPEDLVFLGAAP